MELPDLPADCFSIIAPSGNEYAPVKRTRRKRGTQCKSARARQGKYIPALDRSNVERVESLARLYASGGQVCTDTELEERLTAIAMVRFFGMVPTNQTSGLPTSPERSTIED